MSQKLVFIPNVGQIILAKRRGARTMRLSVTASGQIRVSMPSWAPYRLGVEFARTRSDWIAQHAPDKQQSLLRNNHRVGKAHRIIYEESGSPTVTTRISTSHIKISSALSWDDPVVQLKARQASERALKQEASHLLPQQLEQLANKYNYDYADLQIRKLTSRWGSCSSTKKITLSYFLIQLPWDLIDYVLIHELVHTKHMNHGTDFWEEFERVLPDARAKRRQIHSHYPRVSTQV